MKSTLVDYKNPLTQSYLEELVQRLYIHQKSMRHYYDDFSEEELQDLMNSHEHSILTDALAHFYDTNHI